MENNSLLFRKLNRCMKIESQKHCLKTFPDKGLPASLIVRIL